MRSMSMLFLGVAAAVAIGSPAQAQTQPATPAPATSVTPAPSAPEEMLVEGRWRLPRSHQYESYTSEGNYVRVEVPSVPSRLDRGESIYDRTAKAWVSHPSTGLNAKYLAAAPGAADVLSDGRWRLPRSHHYELYNAQSGTYSRIDVGKVAALADKGQPVYDRTDNVWVSQIGRGPNARYLASTTPAPAVSAPEEILVEGRWRLPRSHQYESYNADGNYVRVELASVPLRLDRGESIYDRTAKGWVAHPSIGVNPKYVGTPVPMAGPDVLSEGRWRLPRSHHYELYNAQTGTFSKVEVAKVPALAEKGQPIYDRTDSIWVFQSERGPNQRFLASTTPAPAVPPTPAAPAPPAMTTAPSPAPQSGAAVAAVDVLSEGRWRLPRSHQYELYDTATATYGKVDVAKVPALAEKGQPIFDRTDRVWVWQIGQGANARYLVKERSPRDKDDCKKDGWKRFTDPAFKNQVDCVSWANAHR